MSKAISRIYCVVRYVVLVILAILMIYPLLWMLGSSFKPADEIFTNLGILPHQPTLNNYSSGWNGVEGYTFGRFILNSVVVSGLSVIGNVLTCSLTAFAFARLRFLLQRLWFSLMLVTIMLPFHVTLVPQYILYHELGWVGTYLPLIVPHWLGADAFFTLLIVQFIRSIPRELDESAVIDGCGYWQIYWRVILPLARPALITTAIFTFYWTWNDFFSQMIYLNSAPGFTVSVGLMSMIDQSGQSNYGALYAMSVLSLIPVAAVFFASQRRIGEGIMTTGFR